MPSLKAEERGRTPMDLLSDPKHVVGELRSFCQRRDQGRSDAVQSLSEAYAALCRKANRRLQRCDELLHKGLRGEAIQLAEQEPVLLELVSQLQFAELAAWEELAGTYGYTPPARLFLQSAEALNRAYVEYEPLKPLMKEHRRLALVRAPMAERLPVLRKLAQLDAASGVWQDDLDLYEEERQRQLRKDIDTAFNRQEDHKVHTYLRELIETPWRTLLTQEFFRPIMQQYLEVLARGLESCQKNGDVAQARQLFDEWSRVAPMAGLQPTDRLSHRVELVRRMIDRDDKRNVRELQFQSALIKLQEAVEDEVPREELEEVYSEVAEFDRPLPKAIADAYDRRLRALSRKHKQFERLVLLFTIVGGALLLAGFVFFMTRK